LAIVEKTALVPYPAEKMFAIVADVAAYPEFLPWCRSTRLLSHTDEELCGEIEVSKAGVTQAFSTWNRLYPHDRMEIRLVQGPFRKLEGAWQFDQLREDACKVSLTLEFDFSNSLMSKAFGVIFGQIANTLVDAFCKRAGELLDEG